MGLVLFFVFGYLKPMQRSVFLLLAFLFFSGCSSEEEHGPGNKPKIEPLKATNVKIRDVRDIGNASDFQLTFNRAADEEGISEYRAFLLPAGYDISVEEATKLSGLQILVLRKGLFFYDTTFPGSFLDGFGMPVETDKPYQAWVISVADGKDANTNVLSSPSVAEEIRLRNILVTYIGNAGIMVEGFGKKVIIDGLPGNLTGWKNISSNFLSKLASARDPFHDVNLLFFTHNHGDHFSPSKVNQFVGSSPDTKIIGPQQVLNEIILPGETPIPLKRFEYLDTLIDGIQFSVFHFRHFDMFGNDYSAVDNYGYMVDIGDFRVLHLGDVLFSNENFDFFDFTAHSVDLLFFPAFGSLISQETKGLIDQKIAPKHMVAIHLQNSTTPSSIEAIFGDIEIFTISEQTLSF